MQRDRRHPRTPRTTAAAAFQVPGISQPASTLRAPLSCPLPTPYNLPAKEKTEYSNLRCCVLRPRGHRAAHGTHVATCSIPVPARHTNTPSWPVELTGACAAPSMMPAHSRHSDRHSARAPAPSLPPVNHEATAPFSDLFKSGFDAATVDATAQLADRSIFVASNGRRYLVESLPDDSPVYGRVPTSPPVPAAAAPPASFYTPSPTISGSPAPAYPAYPVYHPVPPPQFQVHAPGPGPGWGRSSNVSSHSSSPSAYSARSGYAGGVVPGSEPRGPAHQVTNMMARLNMNRFSATPMYGMSDGGVQAAETLTDPDLAPRSPTSPTNPTGLSPRASYFDQQQHQQPSPPPHPQASSWGPYGSPGAAPQHWTNINYADYTVQANQHLQSARQRAVATTGLPSLLEGATTLTPPHRASDPAFSTDKEVWEGPTSGSPYYYSPLHASVSAPSSYVNRGPPGEFDTLTPVTVIPHHTPSFSSDGASTGRDNVLPGEDLLFDG